MERLLSAFGNIQTKQRNNFVLDRLQKLAMIKAMLPAKPAMTHRQNDSEYVDGANDLMVAGKQVQQVMVEYKTQLSLKMQKMMQTTRHLLTGTV